MQTVSATEAKNNLGAVLEMAQKQPVTIEKNGKPIVVMVPAEDYEEDAKRKRKEALIQLAHEIAEEAQRNGMTEEILRSILESDDD